MEQGEADFNSTSAWCRGRTAGHNSPWVIPGRVAWRGARMGRRMRHGGWWESGHGRQVSGGRWPDGASPPPDRRGVGAGRIGRRRGSYQGAWRGRVRGWWRPCSMVATRAGANAATIVVAAANQQSHGRSSGTGNPKKRAAPTCKQCGCVLPASTMVISSGGPVFSLSRWRLNMVEKKPPLFLFSSLFFSLFSFLFISPFFLV